ncbi:unnamed protein product [Durusdinium trenchii]|uniref:Insulin-degrading enzyme n=1 Tax=Durusdinium trenchii TaxID=1381693 RepID=A0ABP0NQ76_9DINO
MEIHKPDAHRREYAYFELPNQLKVVVGSDPHCDKAGAALTVNTGLCDERKDLPGLAHFLEHMLFTGTKKYPKEGEYSEFVKQNGGTTNANTGCYTTNYMFQVKVEALEETLDRFARFFSEPLLTKDCTDREINAVDSEFQAGLTHPAWRDIGILNMSANPAHPFHVACGNNKMLRDDPKEKGLDLYEEMLKFYRDFYSANGMTLSVIGKESIPELEAMIREKFSVIVNKNLSLPRGDAVSDQPPFLPKEWNRLLLQSPVKDVKTLKFSWVLPWQAPLWRSKPKAYATHLLGHEGSGSLTARLKERGLIASCVSSGGGWLEGAFSLLHVQFVLTDGAVHEVEEIGKLLFTYIGMLQKVGAKQWILEEMQRLHRIQFKFMPDRQPFSLAASIAANLQVHPPAEVLSGPVLIYDLDVTGAQEILERLTLEAVRVTHQAKVLEERCTERDSSYDSPMKFEELPDAWRESWCNALHAGSTAEEAVKAAEAVGLHLPHPNPFIPEDLDLKALATPNPVLPRRLQGGEVTRYLFHRQDDVFLQPKALFLCVIRSSLMPSTAMNALRATVYTHIVQEALSEYSYDADIANCSYSLDIGEGSIIFMAGGFHDKLGVLIQAVAQKMVEIGTSSLDSVPENYYRIVVDRLRDGLRNQAFHSQPLSQAKLRFNELSRRVGVFAPEEFLKELELLTREKICGIVSELFSCCHAEAMIAGNQTPEDAQKLVRDLEETLKIPSTMQELKTIEEAAVPSGRTLWNLESTDKDDPNHAVVAKWQLSRGVREACFLQIVNKILSPKFFDILRTQQQLGYVVGMGIGPSTHFNFLTAQVQTEFPPDYVRSRIDAFFEEHFKWLEEGLEEEEFQTCLKGALSELQMKPKNLSEEFGRYQSEFFQRTYDFDRRDRKIQFLESGQVTLQSLRAFVAEIRAAPLFYVQVRKVLDKEDKPLPENAVVPKDPPDLRILQGYEEGRQQRDELFRTKERRSKTFKDLVADQQQDRTHDVMDQVFFPW